MLASTVMVQFRMSITKAKNATVQNSR